MLRTPPLSVSDGSQSRDKDRYLELIFVFEFPVMQVVVVCSARIAAETFEAHFLFSRMERELGMELSV